MHNFTRNPPSGTEPNEILELRACLESKKHAKSMDNCREFYGIESCYTQQM